MDFFSAVNHSAQRNAPTDADDVDAFAHAIASRHHSCSHPVTARLTPTAPTIPPSLRFPSSPMAKMSLASRSSSHNTPQAHSFRAVPPSALDDLVNDPSVLIIDIRPYAAYSSARLPCALSLSVPSTLLKRPLFSLSRLSAMLSSHSTRTRFSTWPSASRILVYDADAIAISDSSNIQGLLRKFKNDGFEGDLSWLQGGFQAVWRERRALIDTNPPDAEPDEEDDPSNLPTSVASPTVSLLRPRHLPMSAFSSSSTTAHPASSPSKVKLRSNSSMLIPLPTSQPLPRNAFNPFFDAVRQNVELSQGITERIPLRLPRRVHKRITDLPYNWLREIARKAECAPRVHHHRVHSLTSFSAAANHSPPPSSSEDTSDSDTSPDPTDIEEGTEALAMQFYRIELAEQRRLMGVMERHSRESGLCTNTGAKQASLSFPYSITAGIEKGSKNRYRHIWPFEHARVRLHCRSKDQKRKEEEGSVKRNSDDADSDDYVNASYVQPLGTRRRYIATQGPLDATFNDFWRLCWEQNVHVIVMLTKEVEGSTIKCGAYWVDDGKRSFGPLTLKLVSKVGLPGNVDLERHEPQSQVCSAGDGFFESSIPHKATPLSATHLPNGHRRKPVSTIKRTFELSHHRYPHLGPRKVVQLQYLEWPDMNVPDDARGVLGLVKEIEKGVDDTWDSSGEIGGPGDSAEYVGIDKEKGPSANLDERSGIAKHALGGKERRPVLLHCSAGVGRTGGFIAVDAVLSSLRREMRNRKGKGMESATEVAMEVDDDASRAPNVREGMMTVPIPFSAGGEGQKADTWGAGAGLVMHVPAVVIPETGGEIARTPMQVDEEIGPRANHETTGTSTREWAQAVSDQTTSLGSAAFRSSASGTIPILHHQQQQFHHVRHPRPMLKSTSSSSSSSALPIDSDDSGSVGLRPMVKESSSLGTSISGSSEEERFGGMKRTESPLKMGSGMVSEGDERLSGFGESERESGRGAQRRTRTVSAPHTHLKSTSHPSGAGSSPPASSTTSWLVGRRNRKQMAMFSTADKHEKAPSLPPHVHFRSNPDPRYLLSKSSPPLPHASLSPEHTLDRLSEEKEPRSTMVDYKEPRQLHDLHSPVPLSSFEEPIWEVVQDMREQRMSLCQSLRQYVFVHAAIIEGALMIVDEEREREREAAGRRMEAGTEVSVAAGTSTQPSVGVGSADNSVPLGDRPVVTFAPPPTSLLHVRPSFTMLANASEVSMTSMSSTGKRSASPTELLKEGKKGEVLLSKRPSIKRKQTLPSERGLCLDPRTTMFYKQGQSLHQSGHGSSSASGSAPGLQRMTMPSSSSSSSSLP